MRMNPPTVPQGYVNAPSYEELVQTLELIRHATAPQPDDGGHHEAAHDLADDVLKRVQARRVYEATALPEPVERLRNYAGKTMRTARNPNLTARNAIEVGNWIDTAIQHGAGLASCAGCGTPAADQHMPNCPIEGPNVRGEAGPKGCATEDEAN